jgi:hypothetical protein
MVKYCLMRPHVLNELSSWSNAIGEAHLLCTCTLGIVCVYDDLLL